MRMVTNWLNQITSTYIFSFLRNLDHSTQENVLHWHLSKGLIISFVYLKNAEDIWLQKRSWNASQGRLHWIIEWQYRIHNYIFIVKYSITWMSRSNALQFAPGYHYSRWSQEGVDWGFDLCVMLFWQVWWHFEIDSVKRLFSCSADVFTASFGAC